MKKVQQVYQQFQDEMKWNQVDPMNYIESKEHLLYIYMLLTTEVSEVAEEFRTIFNHTDHLIEEGKTPEEAFVIAKAERKVELGKELADCLAYLSRLANFFEYDLEEELYGKLDEIKQKYKSKSKSTT